MAISTTWSQLPRRLSAWKAKMRTSVARSASTVIGWKKARKRVSNHSTPFARSRNVRLRLPRTSGMTMNVTTL